MKERKLVRMKVLLAEIEYHPKGRFWRELEIEKGDRQSQTMLYNTLSQD